jgi:uncharacterized protein YpmS
MKSEKIKKIIIYILLTLAIVFALYFVMNLTISAVLRKQINSTDFDGQKINVSRISISPFKLGLFIKSMTVDDKIVLNNVTIGLNILHLIKFEKASSPLNYVKYIDISTVDIAFSNDGSMEDSIRNILNGVFVDHTVRIRIDNVSFKEMPNLQFSKLVLTLSKYEVNFLANAKIFNFNVKTSCQLSKSKEKNNHLTSSLMLYSNGSLGMYASIKGDINNKSLFFKQNINIEAFSLYGLKLDRAMGSMSGGIDDLNLVLNGDSLNLNLTYNKLKEILLDGYIKGNQINENIKSNIKFQYVYKDNLEKFHLNSANLSIYGADLGDIDLNIVRDIHKNSKMIFKYNKNNEVHADITGQDIFNFDFFVRGVSVGNVYLNKKDHFLKTNISNMKVSDLPLNPFYKYNPLGELSVYGALKGDDGQITINIKGFQTSNIKKIDIVGDISAKGNNTYFLQMADNADLFSIKTEFKSKEIVFADFIFSHINIANILRALGYHRDIVSGISKGNIFYKKNENLKFNITIGNGVFLDNPFSVFLAKGSFNPEQIEIDSFVLKNFNGEDMLDMNGLIELSTSGVKRKSVIGIGLFDKFSSNASMLNKKSSFKIFANDFKVKDNYISVDLAFNGNLEDGNSTIGKIEDGIIKINDVSFQSIYADIEISKAGVKIFNIDADNGFKGDIRYEFADKVLTARAHFRNSDISGIVKDLTAGIFNANISFVGLIDYPELNVNASLKNAVYRQNTFNITTEFSYIDREISVNKLTAESSKAKLNAKGKLSGPNGVVFSLVNADNKLINKIFKSYLKIDSGVFSVEGFISKTYSGLQLDGLLNGVNVAVSDFKTDKLLTNIKVVNNIVSIGSASLKKETSEINIQKADIDLKRQSFNADLVLNNIKLGIMDLFGKVAISGRKVGEVYKGNLILNDFWINKYKLDGFETIYLMDKNILEVNLNNYKRGVNSNMSVKIKLGNFVSVEDFNFSYDKSVLSGNAVFNKKDFKLNINSSHLNLETAGKILGIPIDMSGNADLHLNSHGSIENPNINISLNATDGDIANVPYDLANIKISVENNMAKILLARLTKKNEISLVVSGEMPVELGQQPKGQTSKREANIYYDFSNEKLSALQYLSDDFIKPTNGRATLRGNIYGPISNLKNNGRLIISGGVLNFDSHLSRMNNVEVDVSFDTDTLKINKFSARAKNGGILLLEGGLKFSSFDIREFNIRIFTKTQRDGIPIEIPELPIPNNIVSDIILKDISKIEPTFDIKITGNADKPKVNGWIVLENSRFNYPPPDEDSETFSFIPEGSEIDIDLRSAKNTVFQNSDVTLLINGEVKLSGAYPNIKAQGNIESHKGIFSLLGEEFDILVAKIDITDNGIYVSGEAEIETYTSLTDTSDLVRLVVTRSNIENLNFTFSSRNNPNMTSNNVLAKVLGLEIEGEEYVTAVPTETGKEREKEWYGYTQAEIQQKAARLINSSLVVPIAKAILRRTGIVDNVRISYVNSGKNTVSAESSPNPDDNPSDQSGSSPDSLMNFLYGTKYLVEKNITSQIAMGYSLLFDQLNNQLDLRHGIEMNYRINNNLFITGNYEMQSDNLQRQADRRIMIRHQIRFGGTAPKQIK